MNINLGASRAIFQADDHADVTANVLPAGDDGNLFRIDRGDEVLLSGIVPKDATLQCAESLQYIADTLGTQVQGRLSPFVRGWIGTAAEINHTATKKGWWEEGVDRNDAEMICLIHCELSEAVEALRDDNPPDDKLPEFNSVEVELADAVIRIMDLAHARGWRVAQAVEAKMKYNETRPHRHGKAF